MTKKEPKTNITKLSEVKPIKFVSSGVPEIDKMTGGYPRGRVTHIGGLQSVGKTHLMIQAMVDITKAHSVLYCDIESAFNVERAKALGAELDKISYSNSFVLEEVCELIKQSINKYDVIILDSVAMLVPRSEHEGRVGEQFVGLKPRLLGQWLRMIEGDLGRSKTALVLVNQMRRNMDIYSGDKFVWPGGMQLQFSSSLTLELKTLSSDKVLENGQRIGHWINVTVKKSKVSLPYQTTKFKLLYA